MHTEAREGAWLLSSHPMRSLCPVNLESAAGCDGGRGAPKLSCLLAALTYSVVQQPPSSLWVLDIPMGPVLMLDGTLPDPRAKEPSSQIQSRFDLFHKHLLI